MSASEFDDLLGGFSDNTHTTVTHTTVTHKTTSHAVFDDDFDLLGQSNSAVHTSSSRDSELLLDFSTDSEIKNGETSGSLNNSSNPFYDMSTDTKSANPFHDFGSGSANPLYDLDVDGDTREPSNPMYEFRTTTTKSPSNPLYETFGSDAAIDEDAEEVDLLSGTNELQEEDDDYGQSSKDHYDESHYQDDSREQQERGFSSRVEHIAPRYKSEDYYQEHHAGDDQEYIDAKVVEEEDEYEENGRIVTTVTRTETRYSGSGLDTSQRSDDFTSNNWQDDRKHQQEDHSSPEPAEQDIIHCNEMSSTKKSDPTPTPRKQINSHKEEHSTDEGVFENEPQVFHQWQNSVEVEEGVYESQPKKRDDVVREVDTDKIADLPPVGTAQSMRAKFMSTQHEPPTPSKHVSHSTHHSTNRQHISEPRSPVERYESKAESGVFESEPVHNPDVVRSGEEQKEELPEKGLARNLANKFRQISSENSSVTVTKSKRDITPERSKRSEHVSEPRIPHSNEYEVKVDAGVFENQPQRSADVVTSDSVAEDYIPERGFAKNVAAIFKQMESTVKSPPQSPVRKREFTPPRDDNRFHQAVVVENTTEVAPDIVHSSDPLEEALPERGMAKNLALRFRQMEVENKNPSSPKAKKELTPSPKDSGVYENQPKQFHADYNRPVESGISENQPVRRDDVVHGDEPARYEEELPERGAAKNLVNKWRQMESEGAKLKSPGSSGRQKEFTTSKEDSRAAQQRKSPRTPLSPSAHGKMDNGSVHPSDLPGQYQPQVEASVFESSPEERSDVIRESDTDLTDGMPKKDTAKKMLARFQSIQAEASKQSPGPVQRKDSESSGSEIYDMMENVDDDNKVGRSKSMRAAIQTEKCGACEKTVYAMERLEMNKRVYHKACFRCTQCKAVLTPKTFAINNDIIFCTTHYKQLFATKGNYDEGFGRVQHKKRWSSNPNLTKDEEEDDRS